MSESVHFPIAPVELSENDPNGRATAHGCPTDSVLNRGGKGHRLWIDRANSERSEEDFQISIFHFLEAWSFASEHLANEHPPTSPFDVTASAHATDYKGLIVGEWRYARRQLSCARNVNRRRCCKGKRFVWTLRVETKTKFVEPLLLFA